MPTPTYSTTNLLRAYFPEQATSDTALTTPAGVGNLALRIPDSLHPTDQAKSLTLPTAQARVGDNGADGDFGGGYVRLTGGSLSFQEQIDNPAVFGPMTVAIMCRIVSDENTFIPPQQLEFINQGNGGNQHIILGQRSTDAGHGGGNVTYYNAAGGYESNGAQANQGGGIIPGLPHLIVYSRDGAGRQVVKFDGSVWYDSSLETDGAKRAAIEASFMGALGINGYGHRIGPILVYGAFLDNTMNSGIEAYFRERYGDPLLALVTGDSRARGAGAWENAANTADQNLEQSTLAGRMLTTLKTLSPRVHVYNYANGGTSTAQWMDYSGTNIGVDVPSYNKPIFTRIVQFGYEFINEGGDTANQIAKARQWAAHVAGKGANFRFALYGLSFCGRYNKAYTDTVNTTMAADGTTYGVSAFIDPTNKTAYGLFTAATAYPGTIVTGDGIHWGDALQSVEASEITPTMANLLGLTTQEKATAPTITRCHINTDGLSGEITFSQPVEFRSLISPLESVPPDHVHDPSTFPLYDDAQWAPSGMPRPAVFRSAAGFTVGGQTPTVVQTKLSTPNTFTFTLPTAVVQGATPTLAYTAGAGNVVSHMATPLATVAGAAITNNSTVTPPGITRVTATLPGGLHAATIAGNGVAQLTETVVVTGGASPAVTRSIRSGGGVGSSISNTGLISVGAAPAIGSADRVMVVRVESSVDASKFDEVTITVPALTDTTAPTLASATVSADGSAIDFNFTEAASQPLLPATGATGFSAVVGGSARTFTSVTRRSATQLRGVLASTIYSTDVVTASYDATSGNVTDSAAAPNALASFTAQAVTNGSTVPAPSGGGGLTRDQAATLAALATMIEPRNGGGYKFTDAVETSLAAAIANLSNESAGDAVEDLHQLPATINQDTFYAAGRELFVVTFDARGVHVPQTLLERTYLLGFTPANSLTPPDRAQCVAVTPYADGTGEGIQLRIFIGQQNGTSLLPVRTLAGGNVKYKPWLLCLGDEDIWSECPPIVVL